MRISFDLDGVIADAGSWFFVLCGAIGDWDDSRLKEARMRYYDACKLKYNPQLFLSPADTGAIITARKTEAKQATDAWLCRHGISLPIHYVVGADGIEWGNYSEASIEVAKRKLSLMRLLDIDLHFDNNPIIVKELRRISPCPAAVLVS